MGAPHKGWRSALMAGMRDDDATNDVEFEVSRLDDAAPNAAPLYTDPTEDAPASGGAAHMAPRPSPENNLRPHRRLLQARVTGLAVALAVAIILVTSQAPPVSGSVGLFIAFAPTADGLARVGHHPAGAYRPLGRPPSGASRPPSAVPGISGAVSRRTAFHLADIRCYYVAAPFSPVHYVR